jgi:hypothetical protein
VDLSTNFASKSPMPTNQNSGYKVSEAATDMGDFILTRGSNLESPSHFSYFRKHHPLQKKPSKPRVTFSKIMDDVLDKSKWISKWEKIKLFVKNKKSQKDDSVQTERYDVFNAILALYAEDEEEGALVKLGSLYE